MLNTSLLAKIMGWAQFVLQLLGQVIPTGGLPLGVFGWLSVIGSLLAGVGIHAASNTSGPPSSGPVLK